MKPFKKLFVRAMTDEDVTRLLDLRIRRISAYDIRKNRGEIDDIVAAIKQCNAKLKNLTKTTIGWLSGLIEKYRDQYPRRTEIETFHTVDKVAVAKANIRLSYDREAGLLRLVRARLRVRDERDGVRQDPHGDRGRDLPDHGTRRRRPGCPARSCTPPSGTPRRASTSCWSTGTRSKVAWGKRVHIERFITNKTYSLVKEGSIGIDFLSEKKNPGMLQLNMVPVKRQKVKAVTVDLGKIPACGLTARGMRLSQKAVARAELLPESEKTAKKGGAKGLLGKAATFAPEAPTPRAEPRPAPAPRRAPPKKKKR